MMRVVGRVSFMAVAVALFSASSVLAIGPRVGPIDANAIPGGGDTFGPRTFTGTGFEQAQGYNVGSISNVNGWDCFGAANATPPGPRCSSGVAGKGNGSAQSLILDQNPNHPQPTNIGAFTPTFKDFLAPTYNLDMRIDDEFGASYQIVPQAPTQTFSTSRILFYYTGYVYILDDPDGAGPGALQFVNVGSFQHLYDQWFTLQMDYDFANRSVVFSWGPDKDNLQHLYTGYLYGGTQVEEIVLFSDNFQSFGNAPSGGPVAAYIDNIVQKPEPGTLAMLGIGAMLALRRRSR